MLDKKFVVLPFYLILFFFRVEAFETVQTIDLSEKKPIWTTVSEGKTLISPIVTPNEIVYFHDGNKICSLANDGSFLWQKKVSKITSSSILAASDDGFVYYIDENNTLFVINPSGITIFSTKIPTNKVYHILAGLDGRFFVFGTNEIFCFGLNGVCKWTVLTKEQSICKPICLSDGSFIFFYDKKNQNYSEAVRFSAFGEELERVLLSSNPIKSCSDKNYFYLLFSDNSIQQYCIQNDELKQITTTHLPENIKIDSNTFFAPDFSVPETVIFSDNKNLISFSIKNQETIRQISCNFPDFKSNSFFTDGFNLIYYNDLWETKKITITQSITKNLSQKSNHFYNIQNHQLFYSDLSEIKLTQSSLEHGYYGKQEKEFIGKLQGFADEYYNFLNHKSTNWRPEISEYTTDLQYIIGMFNLFGQFGDSQFILPVVNLLQSELSEPLRIQLIKTAGDIAFDPDLQLISAISNIIFSCRPPYKMHTALLNECCYSLYKISFCTGKKASIPATKLLSLLTSTSYGKNVNDTASQMLEKLSLLKP